MSAQTSQFEGHSAPPQPAPKRTIHWIVAAAIALGATGVFFYKQAGHSTQTVSPLEPMPARQQVPINKEMENQAATPVAATPALAAPVTPDSTMPPVAVAASAPATAAPDAAAPAQHAGETPAALADNVQILNRLAKIEDAIQTLSSAIAKLSSDFAAWVAAGHPSPDKLSASKQEGSETVVTHLVTHKRVRRPIAKSPVHTDQEQAAARPIVESSPEVLAVDTWNGRPSVAVRNASGVQFLSEGDQAGSYTLKRADNDGQRAVFTDPAGAMTVQQRSSR